MKSSTAIAVGVGAVVVAAGVCVMGFGLGFAEATTFTLQKDSAGVCQPSDPHRITAFYGHKVTWTVTNVNCDPQYVSLRNFHLVAGGGPKKVVKPDPVDGGPIATGASADMTAKVAKLDLGTVYKYEIWVGPAAGSVAMRLDPDIEIWP